MVDDDLMTRLATLAVGSPAVTIPAYYARGPEDATDAQFPMVVVNRVSAPSEQTIDAAIIMYSARYQFSCFATKRRTARTIAEALIAHMQGYVGGLVKMIEHEGDFDLYDPDTRRHEVAVDMFVTY
jgi:hypothetical protein